MADDKNLDPLTISRRTALLVGGTTLAAVSALPPIGNALAVSQTKQGTLSEGTNLAVAVSSDGTTIAFDLLGCLWIMPATGGPAHRIRPTWRSHHGRPMASASLSNPIGRAISTCGQSHPMART